MAATILLAPELFASLATLDGNDHKRVNAFIDLFRKDPSSPGISLERVRQARSPNVWAGRISRELRAILYKDGDSWAIVHIGHHDPAYDWAARREIGRHTITGALQIVEARERVKEVERVVERVVVADSPPLFVSHADDYLISLGIPETWLPTIRKIHNDDQLLLVCEKLPASVAERLLVLASGELVTPPEPVPAVASLADAPAARSDFYVVEDGADLRTALNAPLERWIAFLHPSQRRLVETTFNGPCKVSGSAGTGKTVVAMHRARHLARAGERVLLTSFVRTLCENIERNLALFCSPTELERITVSTVHHQALSLVQQVRPKVRPAQTDVIRERLDAHRVRATPGYDLDFIEAEWEHVVRVQGIDSWDGYRGARRSGRGRGLDVKERKRLWQVFGGVLDDLADGDLADWPGLCQQAERLLADGQIRSPFTAVIVDEVQDLKPPDLRFLRTLVADNPGNLMLCGDTGQRIYPGGFSLRALGIEVRGRSTVLRINYRTTEQIRRLADRMVGDVADDMDGGEERRQGTRSLLRGPAPALRGFATNDEEIAGAATHIQSWIDGGRSPESLGVFARTGRLLDGLESALEAKGIRSVRLSDREASPDAAIRLGTMHRAKGLEFKAVLVIGCGDAHIPNPAAFRRLADPLDREAAIERERRLLYVAMTRARDDLTVTWSGKTSRFLTPLIEKDGETA